MGRSALAAVAVFVVAVVAGTLLLRAIPTRTEPMASDATRSRWLNVAVLPP